jgi:hypothetical protein
MTKNPYPRYTSRNQFANMFERRAEELAEFAARMREAGNMDEACVDLEDALGNLHAAAKWLRDPVK